jgi:hypothetical protein
MRWVLSVALLSERRNDFEVFVGRPEEKGLEELRVDGRIKFTWVVRKKGGIFWTGLFWLSTKTSVELIDPSVYTKFEEITLLVEGMSISQEDMLSDDR